MVVLFQRTLYTIWFLYISVSFFNRNAQNCLPFVSNSGSSCDYTYASKAFLFSLYNDDGYNPVKLNQYQNHQYAMYRCSSYGPTFGSGVYHDIYISDNSMSNSGSYATCGNTYSVPTGYSIGNCGFFTGGILHFTPTDIEVFYEIGD